MSDDMIDGYLSLKEEEVLTFEQAPHPVEYSMYYSV
jgi:glutamine synthetase